MKKITLIFILAIFYLASHAQENTFRKSTIRTNIGLGLNEGQREVGVGLIYSIGWQKSLRKYDRFRLNPQLTMGGFQPLFITDQRDQLTRITNLSFQVHYDFARIKSFSFVVSLCMFCKTKKQAKNNHFSSLF